MDYLEKMADQNERDQEAADEAYEFTRNKVIEAIKKNEAISYGRGKKYTVIPTEADLYDKVAILQKQILQAYVNDDNVTLLSLIRAACKVEIDSLTDLIGDY